MADLDYIPKMECKLSKLYEIMIEKKKMWWEAMGDGEKCLNNEKIKKKQSTKTCYIWLGLQTEKICQECNRFSGQKS